MIIERSQRIKVSCARLARNGLLGSFEDRRGLLEHMNAHAVGSTVALGRTGERTSFERTRKARCLGTMRMPALAGHSFDMVLQRLFFNKDLVAPFALVLPSRIMLIHMHTHGRLIRRGILGALGTDIETLGGTDVRATLKFLTS